MLTFHKDEYEIVIEDVNPAYKASSISTTRSYDHEYLLTSDGYQPSSYHSVTIKFNDSVLCSCILLAGGGASGIHEHSALVHGNSCIIAVGPILCSLSIPSLELEWQAEVDPATCFGIYYSAAHDCFISHGELSIARIDHGGKVLWDAGGRDIFTGRFDLCDDYIEAVDWNNDCYRMEIASGKTSMEQK